MNSNRVSKRDTPSKSDNLGKSDIRIATIDIGKKNFAFYAEDCSSSLMLKLNKYYKSLPKIYQRRVKGPMNSYIENMLQHIYKDGKRVPNGMGVFDIRDNKDSNDLDIKTRVNMQELLKSYEWLWDTCDIIRIEQQYFNISNGKRGKATGANVDAIKLGECCLGWFLDMYWPFKDISYFGAMFKTHIVGALDGLTKTQRKKWTVAKGKEIFELRGDNEAIDLIENYKNAKGRKQKQDDIYDCITMLQALKVRIMIINI